MTVRIYDPFEFPGPSNFSTQVKLQFDSQRENSSIF